MHLVKWPSTLPRGGKSYVLFVVILVLVTVVYLTKWDRITKQYRDPEGQLPTPTAFVGDKLVHLDLKGAPPKISYLRALFPVLRQLGATGLLIEYEDMFPYEGVLRNVSALNAYSRGDIVEINMLAADNSLAIIPLMQSFGHMEFVLKLAEFRHLREVPKFPQVVCPTHNATVGVLAAMASQLLALHPRTTTLHIGCDEVYNLGQCDRCVRTMAERDLTRGQLFLAHVRAVAERIRSAHPTIRLLIWDDEFRGIEKKAIRDSRIAGLIEPVVWKYSSAVAPYITAAILEKYAAVFPRLWLASAFKGATGSDQVYTDVAHHVSNHRSWMGVYSAYRNRTTFAGILITGWQRYDHFAVLCELLPVALPSLAMCLRVLGEPVFVPPVEALRYPPMGCSQPLAVLDLRGNGGGGDSSAIDNDVPSCMFPGADLLDAMTRFKQFRRALDALATDSRSAGWMTEYNVQHLYSNVQLMGELSDTIYQLRNELYTLTNELVTALRNVYDNYTVYEWTETYITPLQRRFNQMWERNELLLSVSEWPRRPNHIPD